MRVVKVEDLGANAMAVPTASVGLLRVWARAPEGWRGDADEAPCFQRAAGGPLSPSAPRPAAAWAEAVVRPAHGEPQLRWHHHQRPQIHNHICLTSCSVTIWAVRPSDHPSTHPPTHPPGLQWVLDRPAFQFACASQGYRVRGAARGGTGQPVRVTHGSASSGVQSIEPRSHSRSAT